MNNRFSGSETDQLKKLKYLSVLDLFKHDELPELEFAPHIYWKKGKAHVREKYNSIKIESTANRFELINGISLILAIFIWTVILALLFKEC